MLARTRLVGRGPQLAELQAVREAAAKGRFRCVLLSGEPGVGKSRLAAETLPRSRDAIGLVARAYPMGETSPMGVWAEAFETHLRSLSASEITELCGGFVDDLSALCRSVAALRKASPDRDPPRSRLLQGMGVLLRNLSRRALTQIVIDDIHLADSSSWEALHYLAGSLPRERILIVATARPSEIETQPGAREVLLSLHKDGILSTLHVPPLARPEVGELARAALGREPSHALIDWLVDHTRGNPMFALSLMESLVEHQADLSAPQLASLPDAIAGLVESQLKGLDEAASATLELISVIGQRVEFGDLMQLSARPVERLEAILVKLVNSKLLAEDEVGGRLTYEIAHPLVREAIFQRIGRTRRQSIHRLVGRTLLASGRLGAAAPHFVRSAGIGDVEAIEALRDAVRQAEETEAYREALTILNSLVQLLPAGDERWLEVLDAFSWQPEWVVDHRADVHAALGVEAAREIDRVVQRSEDPARRGAVKFRLASFLAWGTGELLEAERCCTDALALFEQAGDIRSTLLAANELAWIDALKGDFASSEERARNVIEASQQAGETFPMIQAVGVKGYALFAQGRFAEAEGIFRKSVELSRQASNSYRLTMSLSALALVLAFQGRIPEAAQLLAEARSVYAGYGESILLEWSAIVWWLAGDFKEVLATAQVALASNAGGLSRRRGYALPFAAVSSLEIDEPEDARRFLEKAKGVYGNKNWSFCSDFCSWAEALLLARQGRNAQAVAVLRTAADNVLGMKSWPWASPILLDLAETAYEAGDKDVAAKAAEELRAISELMNLDLYRGLSSLAAGWAALASGDHVSAAAAAEQAANELSGTGCQAFLGRALDLLGRSVVGSDRQRAVSAFEQAAVLFLKCHSPHRRNLTIQALSGLGSRGRRAAAGARGPESLTPREREVLQLAEAGHTAKEIAERLFIGYRTVETHLSNAYAKLGVPSKLVLLGRKA